MQASKNNYEVCQSDLVNMACNWMFEYGFECFEYQSEYDSEHKFESEYDFEHDFEYDPEHKSEYDTEHDFQISKAISEWWPASIQMKQKFTINLSMQLAVKSAA